MQQFNINDAILILPRFAHLYSDNSAVVIEVKEDPLRPLFNEYTVEFADGQTAALFEFQISENRLLR